LRTAGGEAAADFAGGAVGRLHGRGPFAGCAGGAPVRHRAMLRHGALHHLRGFRHLLPEEPLG
ncbi:unnamed protein product, partial [Effrenium voratum]